MLLSMKSSWDLKAFFAKSYFKVLTAPSIFDWNILNPGMKAPGFVVMIVSQATNVAQSSDTVDSNFSGTDDLAFKIGGLNKFIL